MNYRQNPTDMFSRIRRALVFLAATLIVLFGGGWILSVISPAVTSLASGIWRGGSQTTGFLGSTISYFRSKDALSLENEELKMQIEAAHTEIVRIEELKDENESLRTLLGQHKKSDTTVLGQVLVRPPTSPYDTLVIDQGTSAGIAVGDYVRASGFVIGYVSRADNNFSVVRLWSYPGNTFDVSIGKVFSGKAEGQGGGAFKVRFPRDLAIGDGDIVSVPLLGGLLIGTVQSITRQPEDPFAEAFAGGELNIGTIQFVEVLLGETAPTIPVE